MRPSTSENSGDWLDCSNPACGRQIRLRRISGTRESRGVLRDSASRAVRGPIPGEPESCLGQVQAFQSSVASVAISQTLNVVLLDELFPQLFLVGRRLIGHVD